MTRAPDHEIIAALAKTLDLDDLVSRFDLSAEDLRALFRRAAGALARAGEERKPPGTAHAAGSPAEGAFPTLVINVDGASRGNPGPAGAGFAVYHEGKLVEGQAQYLGRITNNQAEYNALILALTRALELGAHKVVVKSDSELMVRQMNGEYRVKNAGLKELFAKAKALASTFQAFSIQHVPREQNQQADRMANRAIDEFGG